MTGVEAKRMRKTMNHTISPLQLVAGDDRRLHHGVAMTRDAIQAAPIIQKYTVQGYCYDLKPAITSIQQQVQVPPSGKMARSAHAGKYTGELLHAL